jgi:hypothetical protein
MAHRRHAEAVPEGLRAQMSGAELAARCAEMERLDRAASVSGLDPDVSTYLASRKKRIANAMLVVPFIERKRELGHLADGAGYEAADAYRAVARKLATDHKFPDGLEAACDLALLGRPSTDEAEVIVSHSRHGR